MKKIITLLMLVLSYHMGISQWKSLTAVGDDAARSAYFSINNKGYIICGSGYSQNMYSYDPSVGAGGTWTAMTQYPVNRTDGLSGCSLNGIGYAGIGATSGYVFSTDFYKYVPNSGGGTWTSLAAFPGLARSYGVMFALGGKIYAGGGLKSSCCSAAVSYNDFYCYDPVNNT